MTSWTRHAEILLAFMLLARRHAPLCCSCMLPRVEWPHQVLSSLSKEAGCSALFVKFPQPVNETTRELKQLDSQLEQLRFAARQFLRSYRVVNARTARSRVPRAPIGYNLRARSMHDAGLFRLNTDV